MTITRKFTIKSKSLSTFQQTILKKADEAKILRNDFEEVIKIVKDRYFYHEKVTIQTPSDPKKFIFSENLDYSITGKNSIWGNGDLETLAYLNSLSLSLSLSRNQHWLNVCAGDGRYNNLLLKKIDKVTACDIDKSALAKLWHQTPPNLRHKLLIRVFNITDHFPFADHSFDGIFCTGILHLFPRKILLEHIFAEFERVIKKVGRIIFDFATDIKRVYPNGKLYVPYGNTVYQPEEFLILFNKYFRGSKIVKLKKFSLHENLTKTKGLGYTMTCEVFLADVQK